jgi:hypothetical protein
MAQNGHGPMSDLSPLSGEERKSHFGAVMSPFDPHRTLGIDLGNICLRRVFDRPQAVFDSSIGHIVQG